MVWLVAYYSYSTARVRANVVFCYGGIAPPFILFTVAMIYLQEHRGETRN